MEEVVTCICGCQKMIVYRDLFECSSCGKKIVLNEIKIFVHGINKQIRKLHSNVAIEGKHQNENKSKN